MILLVLLGMLALFGATAFAFLVITAHGNRAAKSLQKVDRVSYSPQQDLDETVNQVLRGPRTNNSVLYHHSLLEDIYGTGTVGGWVISPSTLIPPVQGQQRTYRGLEGSTLPALPPLDFGRRIGNGQLIEFIAGFTIPRNADTVAGSSPHPTYTVPLAMDPLPATTVRSYTFGQNGEGFQRRVGCVLTMIDPKCPAFNKSTRIVGYRREVLPAPADNSPPPSSVPPYAEPRQDYTVVYHRYQILPFEGVSVDAMLTYFGTADIAGDNFVINGTPFSGVGMGYQPLSGLRSSLNDGEYSTTEPYALLPNPTDPLYHANLAVSANEDYDAVDYQNMLLALQLPDDDPTTPVPDPGKVVTPSLHRPELYKYWSDVGNGIIPLALERRISLRPLTGDHPGFDGSNPSYTPIDGPWDVDNDGDGRPDSIWVDIGLPLRTLPDGRRYKPLAAILCLDLDGRLNLNTAGSIEQAYTYFKPGNPSEQFPYFDVVAEQGSWPETVPLANRIVYAGDIASGSPPVPVDFPRGQGAGTAEISLRPLFGAPGNPATYAAYRRLLLGDSNAGVEGRYGELEKLMPTWPPKPGETFPCPGQTFTDPFLASPTWPVSSNWQWPEQLIYYERMLPVPVDNTGAPLNYNYFWWLNRYPSLYGSPLDLKGTLAVGLDLFGQPIYATMYADRAAMYEGWSREAWERFYLDTPYELKLGITAPQGLGAAAGLDNVFTAAEFEAILRPYDLDALRLPNRLRRLLNPDVLNDPSMINQAFRYRTTTESWDIPAPNLALPKNLREILPDAFHASDLIAAKLLDLHANYQHLLPYDPSSPSGQPLKSRFYPAPETVDMRALLSGDVLGHLRFDLNRPFGNGIDDNGNGVVDEPGEDPAGTVARMEYVRTLYILMMALVDQDWYPPWDEEVQNPPLAPSPSPGDPDAGNWANVCQARVRAKARARALAQWAVNIVDFRDSDAVMTAFEYDPTPFEVNRRSDYRGGDPTGVYYRTFLTDGDPSTSQGWEDTDKAVVWGCERPELLITETLAFHDRGTQDTDRDAEGKLTTDSTPDADFDQVYRPQGSLYVEIYNPSPALDSIPGEFQVAANTLTGGVILGQKNANGDPVWRLAVSYGAPEAYKYADPDEPYAGGSNRATIDRVVYFAKPSGAQFPDDVPAGRAFYPSTDSPVVVRPNQYTVIGPGERKDSTTYGTTYVGKRPDGDATKTRRIVLAPPANYPPTVIAPAGSQIVVHGTGDPTTSDLKDVETAIQPPTAVVVDTPQRLSVSEPIGGYTLPAQWVQDGGQETFDPATVSTSYTPPIDVPLDKKADGTWQDEPLGTNGTKPGYRYIHLQRLANPLVPYNNQTNRYLTVDTSVVDLTVFNGVADRTAEEANGDVKTGTYGFYARQRGETDPDRKDPGPIAVWTSKILADPIDNEDYPRKLDVVRSVTGHYFNEDFDHTLGYLNDWFGKPLDPAPLSLPAWYKGAPTDPASTPQTLVAKPFPWLNWLNRPFANSHELFSVPATRSSRLLVSYDHGEMSDPKDSTEHPYKANQERFPHILGYFAALPGDAIGGKMAGSSVAIQGGGSVPATPAAHLYRLLEYLQVPSRFVDSHIHPDRNKMAADYGVHPFDPPNYLIPTYREPGKINLNTLFSSIVWEGLGNDDTRESSHPGKLPPWAEFVASRRGYDASPDYLLDAASPALPTRFANPFRSFAGADLVPPLTRRGVSGGETLFDLAEIARGGVYSGTPPSGVLPGTGVNATLLRKSDINKSLTDDTTVPLFVRYADEDYQTDHRKDNNPKQNPFFYQQSLQRLSNLVTTRSNVYAVWITVGYFEMERRDGFDPATQAHIYPDGYTFGQELGIDTGEVKRHRGFYIIDRSIPVGFIPGKNLNAENAVILKRFIE